MNKTIIININSIVFHIEEDAYETLRSYMIEIKRHFGKSEDSKEILEDIENRIAEMFSDRIKTGRKEVINMTDVNEVIGQMGRVSDFETEIAEEEKVERQDFSFNNEEEPAMPEDKTEEPKQTEPNFTQLHTTKKLMRDMDDRVIGGVCSGLGVYFGIDSKWIRVIFILFFLFGGSGVLLYVVLWAVMPKALTRTDKMAMRGEEANLQNFKKSFDEEMKGIQDNFSEAGERIHRSAGSIGNLFSRIVSIFGKILAFSMLIFAGLSVIGIFIFFVFNVLNIMGYRNDMVFPPLEYLDASHAFFAILAGSLAVGIPFLALFFMMLRIILKSKPMNNYATLTLFAIWIVSIIMVLYFVVVTNQEFIEESTISIEKPLDKKDLYLLSEHDVRVIRASDEDLNNTNFNISKEKERLGDYFRSDIGVRFEPIDSLKAPYMQYNYHAKGKNYRDASTRASKIAYQVKQTGEKIVFDSHFSISENQLIRDQGVNMILFLPVGTKIKVEHNLDNKLRVDWENLCQGNQESPSSEWIMTNQGLKCIKKLEEDAINAAEKAKEKKEEKKNNVDVTIEGEETTNNNDEAV
ncbi:PspC domain-containing protein [Sphingobacterium sp. HJSM2_6]|uniref:PspC domain-containing protein n=1 Tax=Sphingobacterium sp. HJSM2_6 TaxID=3366264 RepID=UPI003BC81445